MDVNRQAAVPLWMRIAGAALLLFGLSLWLLRLSDATGLFTLPTVQGQSYWLLINLILAGGALAAHVFSLSCKRGKVYWFFSLGLLLSACLAIAVHLAMPSSIAHLSPPSVNAALAFAVGAVALLLPLRAAVVLLSAFGVALLAILGFVGLLFGFDPVFGWSQEMHMTVHAAAGLSLFAFGLFALGWQRVNVGMDDPVHGASLLVGAIILLATIAACFMVYAAAAVNLQHVVDAGLSYTHDVHELYLKLHQDLWKVLPFAVLILMTASALIASRLLPVLRALRASELRYRTIVQHASDGIVLLEADRRFLDLNVAACRLFGGSREQLLGLRPDELLVPEDVPAMREAMTVLGAGGMTISQRRLRRLDGREIVIEVSSQGLADGTSISLLRDITERQRMEQALRRSEAVHRTVIEVLAEGIVVQDMAGHIISANEAAAHILGRSVEDLIGRHSGDETWDAIHEDGSPFLGYEHPSMVTLRRGEPQLAVVMGVLRPDGVRVWISINSRALWGCDNQGMFGVVSSFQNITERHEYEQQVTESRARLRALTEHLQDVREEEKAHIAREIHDELGGTLTALKMDAVWLARRLASVPEPVLTKLDGISALVDGAINITRRIITELRPAVLDDLGLWAAIEWQAREFEQRTGVECTLDMMCDEVVLNEHQSIAVFRVVQEALTNISRHAQAEHVSIECRWRYDILVLRVVDDGVGFDQSLTQRISSHGIRGMYERIGQIGGKLEVSSRPHSGCTVEIRLPWSQSRE